MSHLTKGQKIILEWEKDLSINLLAGKDCYVLNSHESIKETSIIFH